MGSPIITQMKRLDMEERHQFNTGNAKINLDIFTSKFVPYYFCFWLLPSKGSPQRILCILFCHPNPFHVLIHYIYDPFHLNI